MPTIDELRELQSLPLDMKIWRTQQRIREWVNHYGENGVYVSFSGGKDSTVLLHIVREMYPDIEAVFVNTGLEYPEIQKFAMSFPNVKVLYPEIPFYEVMAKRGYPLISKTISHNVSILRNKPDGDVAHNVFAPDKRGPFALHKWKPLGKLETTQQKVGAAMQMFLDKTEYAAGNYSRENDTFSGSLTTLKAEFENLTADLGTTLLPTATTLVSVARSGLELISPMVISLGEGLNSVAQYLMDLSPSAKTMLGVMVASAVVIPAVTKAQALYNAANAAWKGLLSILIPKQITFNSVLKATFGWLAIIAGVLAIVAQVGAKRRELDSGDLEQTAEDADKASKGIDGVSESYEKAGESAETAAKKLADIDTLNIFDGSSGGFDFDITKAADEAEKAVKDAQDQVDNFNLDDFLDTFSNAFIDIKLGFDTIFDAFNFDSDTQLESLRTLRDMIKDMFGEKFTDYWEGVGATIYKAFNGNDVEKSQALGKIQNFLEDIQKTAEGIPVIGMLIKLYNNSSIYDGLFSFGKSINETTDALGKAAITGLDISESQQQYIDNGYSREDAWVAALKDNFGVDISEVDGKTALYISMIAAGMQEFGNFGMNFAGALTGNLSYTDYSTASQATPGPQYAPSPSYSTAALTDSAVNKQPIEIHTTVELDGNAVGESVTTYQERENLHSNGY